MSDQDKTVSGSVEANLNSVVEMVQLVDEVEEMMVQTGVLGKKDCVDVLQGIWAIDAVGARRLAEAIAEAFRAFTDAGRSDEDVVAYVLSVGTFIERIMQRRISERQAGEAAS